MSHTWLLPLYSVGVVFAALLGGIVPLRFGAHPRRLEFFLAASAGMVLGVVGAHMLPEAFREQPADAARALIVGFVFMLLVERFVLPHALHAPHAGEGHEGHPPDLERQHVKAEAAGVGTFLGLALHTLGDGMALGAVAHDPSAAPWVFLAIVAHKGPSAFALGSILVRAGARPALVLGATALLGAMVGVGAVGFVLARDMLGADPRRWAPLALAFSAGSFLHVAVTDLLPDLHKGRAERSLLLLSALAGFAGMVALSFVFEG